MDFGSNSLTESGGKGESKSQCVDVIEVQYTAKPMSQVVRFADSAHALARRTDTRVRLVIHAKIVHGQFAVGAGSGAEPAGPRNAAFAVVCQPEHQIHAGIDRPEKPTSDDVSLLGR